MRRMLIAGGCLALLLTVTSIGLSLTEPPQEQCDACGHMMVRMGRATDASGARIEYRCKCGMLGTRSISDDGRETWWEWQKRHPGRWAD